MVPHSGSAPAWRPATRLVAAGRPPHEPDQPLNVPLTMAAPYVAGGDREYGRYANPTWTAFEDALGALEGGRALSYASGMAAISAVLDLVGHGERVVAPRHAYQGSLGLLADLEARGRVAVDLVDITDATAVATACDDAALLWLESPTNPALEVVDVAALAAVAHEAGATVVVDNTFATPLLQQPLALGADISVHSVTKYLSGHSDVVMGALVTRGGEVGDVLKSRRDLHGAVPGPLDAWLALRGLRTLDVRLERAQRNARELATRLATLPEVAEVRDPGFGAVIAPVLTDPALAERWTASTRLWVHATSLGGVESTLERRRRWRTESPTIPEGLVRLAVGIEDVDDLWTDLVDALESARG